MTDLVYREPDEWQRSQPKEQKGDKVVDGGAKSDLLVQSRLMVERGPDGCYH